MDNKKEITPDYGTLDHYLGDKGVAYFGGQNYNDTQMLYNKHIWPRIFLPMMIFSTLVVAVVFYCMLWMQRKKLAWKSIHMQGNMLKSME